MSKEEKIQKITQKLEKGIEDLFHSEQYKRYLTTMSKFTSYSLNNTLLIAMQKPDATAVAGYNTWKSMGRNVMKGEKAIKILAPIIYKKKEDREENNVPDKKDSPKPLDEEKERILVGFKAVNVFDISQTDGEPLPEITHKLDGSVQGYADFMKALESFSNVPVMFQNIEGPANGYYDLKNKQIVIEQDMSEVMHCKTGIHELAHSLLHDKDNWTGKEPELSTGKKEVQAESVAFAVCNYYGIDTGGYSFGYISGWSSGKGLKELRESMEIIRKTAQNIITGIDLELDKIKLSKRLEVSKENCLEFPQPKKTLHGRAIKR